MATSVPMQSILASTVSGVGGRTSLTRPVRLPSNYVVVRPQQPSTARLPVLRCMAEEVGQKEKSTPISTPSPSSRREVKYQPIPPPASKVSTKFSDVFAFSGPAPERINGRLAMIGFVAAMAVEVFNGQDVFTQMSNGGTQWFVGTSILLSIASLVPLFKGVSVQSKSEGIMTSDAEMWNGRFAMLGLVALAFTEYVKGGALV